MRQYISCALWPLPASSSYNNMWLMLPFSLGTAHVNIMWISCEDHCDGVSCVMAIIIRSSVFSLMIAVTGNNIFFLGSMKIACILTIQQHVAYVTMFLGHWSCESCEYHRSCFGLGDRYLMYDGYNNKIIDIGCDRSLKWYSEISEWLKQPISVTLIDRYSPKKLYVQNLSW